MLKVPADRKTVQSIKSEVRTMILADKIIQLRKQSGWSQEDLAEKLSVSRQSVSKWESAASIPDLNRILQMSSLFGVSTDYLLRDELDEVHPLPTAAEPEEQGRRVSLALAREYLDLRRLGGRRLGVGTALCILSPCPLFLLMGGHDFASAFLPEAVCAVLGIVLLLMTVAAGCVLFMREEQEAEAYKFFKKEALELEYGAAGVVEEEWNAHKTLYHQQEIAAVALLILSPIPLLLCGALGAPDLFCLVALVGMFMVIAAAVYLLIRTDSEKEAVDILLQRGKFSPEYRRDTRNARLEKFRRFFWCALTALYLGWSFWTDDWKVTWIVWPVGALIYAAIAALLGAREDD